MRSLLGLFLFTVAGLLPTWAAEVEFVRVWPAWRDVGSFERISEYFTGKENSGSEIVVRTQAEERAGFYYLVRVANKGEVLPGAKFVLRVILPTSPDPKVTIFPAEIPRHSKVFQLGLTGADWPGPEVHPVAWKLELQSATDQVLATAQSFLWSKPPGQ